MEVVTAQAVIKRNYTFVASERSQFVQADVAPFRLFIEEFRVICDSLDDEARSVESGKIRKTTDVHFRP